ncbi:MAG: hypothetical protein ACTXOO_02035 [Sodalis sp. (in: enterobacteria)]
MARILPGSVSRFSVAGKERNQSLAMRRVIMRRLKYGTPDTL